MWPLLERVIEVWCCRMPYTVCLAGWLTACLLWLVSCRVDTCHGATATLPFEPGLGQGQGQGKKRKQFQFASLKRLGVVSADGLSLQARKRTSSISSLCGICTEFEFDKVQNPLHFEDWLTSYPWMDLNGNIIYHPALPPPACWCSVNKRKIIKM